MGPALGVPKTTDISKKTDDLWIWNCLVLSLTVLIMNSLQKSCSTPHHPSESPFFVWQLSTCLLKAVLVWNCTDLGDILFLQAGIRLSCAPEVCTMASVLSTSGGLQLFHLSWGTKIRLYGLNTLLPTSASRLNYEQGWSGRSEKVQELHFFLSKCTEIHASLNHWVYWELQGITTAGLSILLASEPHAETKYEQDSSLAWEVQNHLLLKMLSALVTVQQYQVIW